jgi:phosphoribosylformylglycinamidine synthase
MRAPPLPSQEISGLQAKARATSRRNAAGHFNAMKAKIIITPKKAVLDPQGKTVQNALAHIGYTGIGAVHVGKYLEIELTDGDREAARKQIDEACHRILSNPVIEDYRFEIE